MSNRRGFFGHHGPRIAVVHDQLYTYGGAEHVLKEILFCFPSADLFALFDILPDDERAFLKDKKIVTTGMQKLPLLRRLHRHYFALMPYMIEQLDLSGYDIIISSSYLVAKGVLAGPDQLHISYVHSPMRYAWDLQHQYLREMNLERGMRGLLVRAGLHYMRIWDARTAAGVDAFVANSRFIARRLMKAYHREATVVYPPVDTGGFAPGRPIGEREDFFVTVSRLVPYKCVNFIVRAFSQMPERRLVVVGDGPEFRRLKAQAGPSVQLLGHQPRQVVVDLLQRALAFVYAAEEDFGIAPVEAQACGTPVIAYSTGAVRETIVGLEAETPTGVFYNERTTSALQEAIQRFLAAGDLISTEACCANAARFGAERFRQELRGFVYDEFQLFSDRCQRPAQAAEAEVRQRMASNNNKHAA